MRGQRPGQPQADAVGGHGERDLARRAMARAARPAILPHEESDERAGRARGIAIEQVQLVRILEAAGALDQPQAEEARVEVDIRLNAAGEGGDVMETGGHGSSPEGGLARR
ncbi:hypothetical protein SDC9_34420 [bioreactor metagenome]|uniref:Uncharacterized protein n=1 Tax=bioreactor metagenome TaxID=1076179 RepID=A0A644VAU5_9ZZZZ